MCEPTTMMAGSMAMSGFQMYQGVQQGKAQSAMALSQAQHGYAGAMEQYNQEVAYQREVSDYQWSNTFDQIDYRGKMIEYENQKYRDIADAANLDLVGKYNDLIVGVQQFEEATQYKMQNMWLNYHKGQSTRKINSLSRGVEGNSVDALAYEAEAAMRLENEAAITSMQWNADQARRQAQSFYAQTQSTINAAKPGQPMAYITPPAPMASVNPPNWSSYALQAQAGALQGHQTAMNGIIGGAGGMLSAGGTYYSQMNPPSVGNVTNNFFGGGGSGVNTGLA